MNENQKGFRAPFERNRLAGVRSDTFPAVDHLPYHPLAPVQNIMLRDSLAEPDGGHHVEQLEVTFSRRLDPARVEGAWRATLASCEVLRTAFEVTADGRLGQFQVATLPVMEIHAADSRSHPMGLEDDHLRPLLGPGRVPWRTGFWPDSRRWLWTFHHALLDGRSITRILKVFLTHLEGKPCGNLATSIWNPPTAAAVETATETFRRIRRDCPTPLWPHDPSLDAGPAVCRLGRETLESLENRAAVLNVTAATVVTWAWGQALAGFLGQEAVLVEQIRAGAPQPASAGFAMHVLPLMIRRSAAAALPDFRAELLAMRAFETVSALDFPPGIYPDTADAPVIMVEHATLAHALGEHPLIESVTLHERPADFPSAAAFLRPDLRLKVEGPHRHDLLARWGAVLKHPDFCIAGVRGPAARVRR